MQIDNGCGKPLPTYCEDDADRLYRRRQARWESQNLTYRLLDDTDNNFQFNSISDGKGRTIHR